jgi:hypothetical protein
VTAQAPARSKALAAEVDKANSSNPEFGHGASAPRRTDGSRHRHTSYAAEASGLLVIGLLLLILVLIRNWPYIAWSAR